MKMISAIMMFLFLFPSSSWAGWVDDWIAQKTETTPGYFEGQKRGYLSGGAFSARWHMSNDYLFTAEPPRVKFGCGGVDMFTGGLSFLNVDHLVQKLENILSAAPSVAFDLALNTLCEPCSKAIKSMESISDRLNAIQLDDCKAAKVLVAKGFNALTDNPRIAAEAEGKFSLGTGLRDMWEEQVAIWSSGDGQAQAGTDEMTNQCPAEIRNVFGNPNKTVLQALAEYKGYPTEYVDLARGYVGDVRIIEVTLSNGKKKHLAIPIGPCEQNNNATLDSFFTGDAYKRTITLTSTNCSLVTDTNANLVQWTSNMLSGILDKMKNRAPLTAVEQNFVDTLPVPIHGAMKVAVFSGQESSVVGALSNLVAREYAYGMMTDLYSFVAKTVQTGRSLLASKGAAVKNRCQMELFEPPITEMEKLLPEVRAHIQAVQEDMAKVVNEHNTLNQLAGRYERFQEVAGSRVSGLFGSSVAARTLGQ